MPKYHYTVVNPSNQQLQGTIVSPDETSARKELNELGFSIVAIEEIPEGAEAAVEGELPLFEFAGLDKNQKRVAGTIQAEDEYAAYKRLVQEYEFEVEYVIQSNLSEAQKEKARKKGAYELHSRLEDELIGSQQKETSDEKDLREFEKKQEVLKQQIELVLKKVKAMLDNYEQEMKPETKEKIRKYVDKILRIKSSTNLDYVRKTTEELLEFLQKEELFLHEEAHMKERTGMVVEAKSMMMELKRGKAKKSMNLTEAMRQWREEHIVNHENPPLYNRIIDFFIRMMLGIQNENEEILNLKREIQTVNDQIKHYLILYFQAPSPQFKEQTKDGLKNLWQSRKKLKKKLKEAKKQLVKTRRASGEMTGMEKFAHEMLSFTGWLLAFYLVYYFASIYATSKDFGAAQIPGFFYIYRSAFLKYFMATLFLLHGALSLKIHFFRRNDIAGLIITPAFLISTLIIYLNF